MPTEITVQESFGLFMTTLNRYDASHLLLRDEELLSMVLYELDIDTTSFLHQWTINRLIEHKLIPADLGKEIARLREKMLALIDDKHTIHEIRNDDEWNALRLLAKGIEERVGRTAL